MKKLIRLLPRDETAPEVGLERVRRLALRGNELRPRDIEALLSQAGSMLDTAANERSEFEAVSAAIRAQERARGQLSVQISNLNALKARLDAEIAGSEGEVEVLAKALEAAETTVAAANAQREKLNKEERVEWARLHGILAENSALPVFNDGYPDKDHPGAGRRKVSIEGVTQGDVTLDDVMKTCASEIARRQLALASTQADTVTKSAEVTRHSANASLLHADVGAKANRAERSSIDERISTLQALLEEAEADADAGFTSQMIKRLSAIQGRLSDTMAHAHARLEAANKGLLALYTPFLDLPPIPPRKGALDDRIVWLREVNAQVFSLSRAAQSTVICAPILKVGSPGRYTADIRIPDSLGGSFLGARGVAISLKADNLSTPLEAASVTPPRWDFDENTPSLYVSRLTAWAPNRLPEVFGTSALHNWKVDGRWDIVSGTNLDGAVLHVLVIVLRHRG